MSLKHELDLYLAEQEDRKTTLGASRLPTLPSEYLSEGYSGITDPDDEFGGSLTAEWLSRQEEIRLEEEERLKNQKHSLIDAVGSGLWSFADEFTFGALGAGVHHLGGEAGEEWLESMHPTTTLGQIGAGIGGTVGFMIGAPLNVGVKAAKLAAKPFIWGAGKQTGASVLAKSAKEEIKPIFGPSGVSIGHKRP